MQFTEILLIIISIFNFTVAGFIFGRNKKSHINISFSLMYIFAAFWSLLIALFLISNDQHSALYFSKLYYVAAMLISPAFLYFSFSFPFPSFPIKLLKVIYLFLPAVLTSTIILVPKILISNVIIDNPNQVELLWGYYLYSIVFLLYVLLALLVMVRKYIRSDGVSKFQLKLLIIGAAIGFSNGMLFDLVLPFFGNYILIWIGPLSSFILMIFIYYLISKKE
ncbi:MAG: histidine kinase N-terminal 7TM domain-containing protein [bacterium]|nr:histidine kinase N-terminal 7TM domain-containing protein [bacterium]